VSSLTDRVALVTGGAISIGRNFARALAAEGANLIIADVEGGTATAAELETEFGVSAMSRVVDVSVESEVQVLVAEAMRRFGRIDVLINNAALFASIPITAHTGIEVELWDRVMAVNVRGPFLMAKHVSPHMIAAGYGKIINIGSGTANKGMPDMLAYVTSKAAILGLTRSLARELGAHGICVNTLAPGLIESDSVRANPQHLQFSERVIASRSLQRPGLPDDLLGALVFLAGPASDFITGQTLAVDGGSINT
jgi:NAD(P)-dependent dehydrogenase (short-subunit alcohol dehydrogenase family)